MTSQVDVSYFAEPSIPSTQPKQAPRPRKVSSVQKPPSNVTLVTPQKMAEVVSKPPSHPNLDGAREAGQKPGQKRPYVYEDKPLTGPSENKSKQPPPKKPKKEKASIFIPKKNKP